MRDGKTMMTRSGGADGAGGAGVADDANRADDAVDTDAAVDTGDAVVDHPTQLICIWIFICCQHTKKKDIAG